MNYIPRHISTVLEKTAATFPITIVSGPRQVGKSTTLMHDHSNATYTTFDRLDALQAAQNEPERFLSSLSRPAIMDEIQYCPELFHYIKMDIDAGARHKGQLYLTGSQRFQMMQGADESLAGRAGVVEMLGLSLREMRDDRFGEPFIPTERFIAMRHPKPMRGDLWQTIHRGDLPELFVDQGMDASTYYSSYIETYLRRDVRDLAHVGNLATFDRFLRLVADRHGQILNKTTLASDCGISFATVDRWLSVLQASNIIYLLRPFAASTRKRLVKSPKLYFLNSGVVASLCGLNSGEEMANSPQAGAFFEGFAIAEVVKSFLNATGRFPELYYYRDSNGKEIDLVIEQGKKLYPVEIKAAEIARPADTKAFADLDAFGGYVRQPGIVLCNMRGAGTGVPMPLPLSDGNTALSVAFI